MSKKPTPSAPDFTGDEHWGRGGQYVVVDGKRVPAPPEPEDEVLTTVHVGPATGEPRVPVAGDTLSDATTEQSPALKGN
jgi:hypothetical protein